MAVGIAPNTLLKWMKQPEFDTAYLVVREPSSFIASSGVSATTVGIEPNCRYPEEVGPRILSVRPLPVGYQPTLRRPV